MENENFLEASTRAGGEKGGDIRGRLVGYMQYMTIHFRGALVGHPCGLAHYSNVG